MFLISCTCNIHAWMLQPYGFDVGQSERGSVLKGLDLGVKGMRVGGQVRLVYWHEIYLLCLEAEFKFTLCGRKLKFLLILCCLVVSLE